MVISETIEKKVISKCQKVGLHTLSEMILSIKEEAKEGKIPYAEYEELCRSILRGRKPIIYHVALAGLSLNVPQLAEELVEGKIEDWRIRELLLWMGPYHLGRFFKVNLILSEMWLLQQDGSHTVLELADKLGTYPSSVRRASEILCLNRPFYQMKGEKHGRVSREELSKYIERYLHSKNFPLDDGLVNRFSINNFLKKAKNINPGIKKYENKRGFLAFLRFFSKRLYDVKTITGNIISFLSPFYREWISSEKIGARIKSKFYLYGKDFPSFDLYLSDNPYFAVRYHDGREHKVSVEEGVEKAIETYLNFLNVASELVGAKIEYSEDRNYDKDKFLIPRMKSFLKER